MARIHVVISEFEDTDTSDVYINGIVGEVGINILAKKKYQLFSGMIWLGSELTKQVVTKLLNLLLFMGY